MGAIQGKINNILGSLGAVALATNKYNQGINASEDKARIEAEAKGAEFAEKNKAGGATEMRQAIKKVQQAQKEKKQVARVTREQALQKSMEEIKAHFEQDQEFKKRKEVFNKVMGGGALDYGKK